MIRANLKLYLLLSALILSACGGNFDSRPTGIQDAESYTHEGVLAFAEDNRLRAQQLFSTALVLYQGLDNQEGVLFSHINLAEVALSLNEYPVSLKHLNEASHIVNKTSLPEIQSRITLLYSVNALKQNQITLAESTLHALLPEFDNNIPKVRPNNIQLAAIANRTRIAFVQKKDELLWTQRYAKALKKSAIKSHSLDARLLRFQATLLQREGNNQGAEANLQQALLEYKSIPSRPGIAVTLSELGQLAVKEKRWQGARDYFKRSIAVYRYLKDFDKVSQLSESLAKVELVLGDVNLKVKR